MDLGSFVADGCSVPVVVEARPEATADGLHHTPIALVPWVGVMHGLGSCVDGPWLARGSIVMALGRCGHVSGLLVRGICPLALMKFARRIPNQVCALG